MEIKKLTLKNLGRFETLEVDFAPTEEHMSNVTVFIGNNGAGKTSILEALATSLSWFVARLRTGKGTGNLIDEWAIINNAPSSSITLQLCDDIHNDISLDKELSYQWSLVKARKGRKSDKTSHLSELTKLADGYRQLLTDDSKASLPLIAYYAVDRSVLDIPLKIMGKHSFNQVEGYDGSLNKGVDFRRFFEWFREREDIENEEERRRIAPLLENVMSIDIDEAVGNYEQRVNNLNMLDSKSLIKELEHIQKVNALAKKLEENLRSLEEKHQDKELNAVRTAISAFMPNLSNIRVERKPRLHMAVDKNHQPLNVMQLSQGEKSLMALVGDIARRLAMMNPSLDNPLDGDGIILIDEVDMHLHPSWQRNLLQRFISTFPNCQIILTTHSPLVISDQKNILVYLLKNGEIDILPPLFGKDVNTVLLEAMDTYIRDPKTDKKLKDLLDLIQDNKLPEANKLYSDLTKELPQDNIELAKARLIIRKKELRNEKN